MKTERKKKLLAMGAAILALWFAAATATAAETGLDSKVAPLAAPAAGPRFSIYLQTSSILTEGSVNDTAQGPSFTVTRLKGLERKEKIGWRVVPATPKPVSAEDFECGELPSGELIFLPNVSQSDEIYFGALPEHARGPSRNQGILVYVIELIFSLLRQDNYYGLKKDGIKEGDEFFTVQLYDLDTDEVIAADYSRDSVIPVLDGLDFIKVDDNFYKLVK